LLPVKKQGGNPSFKIITSGLTDRQWISANLKKFITPSCFSARVELISPTIAGDKNFPAGNLQGESGPT